MRSFKSLLRYIGLGVTILSMFVTTTPYLVLHLAIYKQVAATALSVHLEDDIAKPAIDVASLKGKADVDSLMRQLHDVLEERDYLYEENTSLRVNLEGAQQAIHDVAEERDNLYEENNSLRVKLDDAQQAINEAVANLVKDERDISDMLDRHEVVEIQLAASDVDIDRLQHELRKTQDMVRTLTTRVGQTHIRELHYRDLCRALYQMHTGAGGEIAPGLPETPSK